MSFSTIAYIAPNYRDYKNWWLKAYEPGTTTPKEMATDSTFTVLIAKAEINKDGFIVSAGGTLIIPYIDDYYDLWLFPTEAEADANDTVNAERVADNQNPNDIPGELKSIALSLNIPVENIIYGTVGASIPANITHIYVSEQQTTYGKPDDVPDGAIIVSIVGDGLETDVGTYTLYEIITSNNTPEKISVGVTPDMTTALTLLASAVMASIGTKPNIRPQLQKAFDDALVNPYKTFVSSESVGGSGGAVFGSQATGSGLQDEVGIFMIMPNADIDGVYSFSVTINALGSADLNDLTVQRVSYDKKENGGAIIGGAFSMTKSDNTWTSSGTYTSVDDAEVGIRITAGIDSGLYEVVDWQITTANSVVYSKDTNAFLDSMLVTYSWSPGVTGVTYLTDKLNSGVKYRTLGARSGYVPSAVYTSPIAPDDATSVSAYENELKGYSKDNPVYAPRAFKICRAHHVNGSPVPVLIMESGVYENTEASSAYFTFPNTSFLLNDEDFYIGCPHGTAMLTAGTGKPEGFIFGLVADQPQCTVNILNVSADSTMTRHYRFNRVNAIGYNCHADGTLNTTDGVFEMDEADFIWQSCSARYGNGNDGFNSHVSGHTVLIDCDSIDNDDDGFSPHDNCTYEVWGGNYTGSGKGNIIPAFGAQGFCVGVKSADSTGLSPRSSTEGINSGGYVALAYDGKRPTVLVLRDCESDNDINGLVSAGLNSVILTQGESIVSGANTDNKAVSNAWRSVESGVSASSGRLISFSTDVDYSTGVVDEDNKITAYNDKIFDTV